LWAPASGCFSPLAEAAGWAPRFAPTAFAGEVIGTLRKSIAAQTGLSPGVQVMAGLHDSNAALLAARGFAEMADREATVLSTGTWFVAMRMTASELDLAKLPEARDCLVNVDPYGRPVPSARFMGGREIEIVMQENTRSMAAEADKPALLAAVESVVGSGAMVLPTLVPATGPYPDRAGGWIDRPAGVPALTAAAHLYGALVADTALNLVGARECLLIEGRFARSPVFVRALAALRPAMQVFAAGADADVSFGALRLIDPGLVPGGALVPVVPLHADLGSYRATWRDRIAATSSTAR
jgi:sugar (pentulose or hexulose) kinase